MDVRLAWLHCLVAVSGLVGNTTNPAVADDRDLAVLLLDRRLAKTKGRHLTSFLSGSVLTFLAALFFSGSTVLAGARTIISAQSLAVLCVGS